MQHLGRRKRMGFGIILVGFLFLWTGSILFFSLREYCLADAIEGKVCTSLLKTGESQLHFLHMAEGLKSFIFDYDGKAPFRFGTFESKE